MSLAIKFDAIAHKVVNTRTTKQCVTELYFTVFGGICLYQASDEMVCRPGAVARSVE